MKLTPKQQRFVDEYLINVDRFNSYVDRSAGENGCWPWMGAKDSQGYGRFHIGKTHNSAMLAHRIAYGLKDGEEPEAVCHQCDNPPCCNPSHLFGGTRAINNRDMTAKGRNGLAKDPSKAARGERHGSAKLNDGLVRDIRRKYAAKLHTQQSLASEYGVSKRAIAKVVNNIGWNHV